MYKQRYSLNDSSLWYQASWALTYSVHNMSMLVLCQMMLNCSLFCSPSPRLQFPDTCEESASPFVFICTNPQELVVKFPMKGKHKICKSCFFHVRGSGVDEISLHRFLKFLFISFLLCTCMLTCIHKWACIRVMMIGKGSDCYIFINRTKSCTHTHTRRTFSHVHMYRSSPRAICKDGILLSGCLGDKPGLDVQCCCCIVWFIMGLKHIFPLQP